ncbi:MAG: hypothetical protein OXG89_07655 [bacterium]|nr:hypothetical protein [bacterium]
MTFFAHHPYDTVLGFVIALTGIGLILWAERRAKRRGREDSLEAEQSDPETVAGQSRPPCG